MKHTWFVLALVAACGSDTVSPGGTDAPPTPTDPTYYGAVQKIIDQNCVECHSASPDRLAPFSLATYADVAAAIDAQMPIAYDIMTRQMPPFYADQDNCHTFDAKWLGPDDLALLAAFVNGSHQAGDPANADITPPPALPALAHVDHTADTGAPYTPDTSVTDDFRCFVVDPVGADKFVTGVHIKPTNLSVAHHIILFTLDTDAGETEALQKQAAAGGAYPCSGGPTDAPYSFLSGWIPGMAAQLFPTDTGIQIVGSRRMVVQVHYNLASSDGQPDHTTIDLQLADTVLHPAQMIRINGKVDLPPHDPDATAVGSLTVPSGASVTFWGTGVHMHQRGTKSTLTRNSNNECLLDLVNWSFHWQDFYWYRQPVTLVGGDRLNLTCHYDTSADTQNVKFCETTSCEMCIEFGYVTAN